MSTPTSQYFNDISVMRVFAMLLVVLYHCLCPYTSIWDGSPYGIGFHVMAWQVLDGMLMQIHLPIFFLISGYLYGFKRIRGGYSDTKRFVRDKAMRVLLPYIIVGLFLCVLQHRELLQMLNGVSHLWFLVVIFECYMLGKVAEPIVRMRRKEQKILFVAIVLFTIYVPYHIAGIRIIGLSFLLKYFPFYVLGMMGATVEFTIVERYRKEICIFLCLSVIFLLLAQILFRHPVLSNLIGLAAVTSFFACMRVLQMKPLPNWVNSLDKCSMGIYIVHHILIQEMNGISYFREIATTHYYIYPIIQFLIITIVSWGFVALCRKNKYSKYVLG